jgi:hypothetical protein
MTFPHASRERDDILDALVLLGPATSARLATLTGYSLAQVEQALEDAADIGLLERDVARRWRPRPAEHAPSGVVVPLRARARVA